MDLGLDIVNVEMEGSGSQTVVVMAVVDRRHVAVEHGGEVEWVRSWCSTIWASIGLAGRPELGAGLCVELRLVHGTELK